MLTRQVPTLYPHTPSRPVALGLALGSKGRSRAAGRAAYGWRQLLGPSAVGAGGQLTSVQARSEEPRLFPGRTSSEKAIPGVRGPKCSGPLSPEDWLPCA